MDLFDKFAPLSEIRERLLLAGKNPFGVCMDSVRSATEAVIDGEDVILFGTNNYLGLTFDPDCTNAALEAITAEGTGTTGSRIANGTYARHCALERDIARFLLRRSALVFSTGYQANLSVLGGLTNANDYILLDADGHASIYDGCRLGGATIVRFRHNDPVDLEKRLDRLGVAGSNVLIVVEGLYSMLGDSAPLREIVEVKKRYGAYLMVDEAHSFGVYGANGRGLAEDAGIEDDVDFIVGTFSKSLGGIGGFAASNHPQFELLRIGSRPYMYTASPSPGSIASVHAALRVLAARPNLRKRLWRNSRRLHGALAAMGFTICAGASPIIAVKLENPEIGIEVWNRLLEEGIYVNLAIPPGTPNGVTLLRCSVSAAHTPRQIDAACEAFSSIAADLVNLPQRPVQDVELRSSVA